MSEPNDNNVWYQGIDENLLTDKIRGFADINSFVKSYNEGQSFIGKGIPDENTPADIRDAFYKKLGRPDNAEGYEWKLPEGVSVDGATEENFKNFKQLCYEAGLTNKQVSAVLGGWSDIVIKLAQTEQAEREKIVNSSKTTLSADNEWGDKYDDKLNATIKLIESLGIKKALDSAGLLYDVNVLKAFNSILSAGDESKLKGEKGGNMTPQERLEQLKANPAYFSAGHPDHKKVIDEVNAIFATLAGQ